MIKEFNTGKDNYEHDFGEADAYVTSQNKDVNAVAGLAEYDAWSNI